MTAENVWQRRHGRGLFLERVGQDADQVVFKQRLQHGRNVANSLLQCGSPVIDKAFGFIETSTWELQTIPCIIA